MTTSTKDAPEVSTVKVAMDVSGALLDLYEHACSDVADPMDRREFLARARTILADAKPLRGHQVDEILDYVKARTERDAPREGGHGPAPRPVADAPQA